MSETKPSRVSVRMSEDEAWAFVENSHTGIFTTLRRDGVPIALPVWFVTLDRTIYVSTRGKKLLRINHDARASFLVEDGERWAELRAVHLTGRAEVVAPEPELLERYQAQRDAKYAAYSTAAASMPTATREHYSTATRGFVRFTPDPRM